MKKDQILPNKNKHSNNSSGKPPPNTSNYLTDRSPEQRNSRNFPQNRYSRSNSQNNQSRNNYSRSNSNRREFSLIPVPIQILGIDTIQTINHEIHHTIETETIQTIGIGVIQIIEINVIKTIDQETFHATDLNINEPITTTIIIDHEIMHKIGIQVITINKRIILNLLIEIIIAIPILNKIIEALHRNIKDKLLRYK